tara:strand:+ start:6568 stop:8010 length:1443 start_codon:yes stop_codon:yes gene_type:complete
VNNIDNIFKPMSEAEKPKHEMPQVLEIEQALLASLFANNDGVDQVSDVLEPHHFYSELYGEVYAEILRLTGLGKQAIPPTMKGKFEADDLAEIAGSLVQTLTNKHYAKLIKTAYDRRRIIEIADEMREAALTDVVSDDVDDIRERAETELFALASTGNTIKPVTVGDAAAETLDQIKERMDAVADGRITGVPSGIMGIDQRLGGFQPSDLIILAGRPSMGKTALMLSIASNAADDTTSGVDDVDGAIAVFSLEMSKHQLCERLFANKADISYTDIVQGRLDQQTFYRLNEFADQMKYSKMVIDDRPGATVARVRSEARRVSRKVGLKMIVIDYLGFMQGPRELQGNKNLEMGFLTSGLKALAKEMNVPVLLLSQLSRGVEQREDKRPQLSDLRDSGSIEQDADVVMFVYRDQYYLERSEPTQKAGETTEKFGERYAQWQARLDAAHGTAEIIIGKARRGQVGTVRCSFNGDRQRFANLYE